MDTWNPAADHIIAGYKEQAIADVQKIIMLAH